jgi:hypothetical protein
VLLLHQVIINRDAEPEETPEHNALQVRFLDRDFCLRFLACINPNYHAEALEQLEKDRVHNRQLIGAQIRRMSIRRVRNPARQAKSRQEMWRARASTGLVLASIGRRNRPLGWMHSPRRKDPLEQPST